MVCAVESGLHRDRSRKNLWGGGGPESTFCKMKGIPLKKMYSTKNLQRKAWSKSTGGGGGPDPLNPPVLRQLLLYKA